MTSKSHKDHFSSEILDALPYETPFFVFSKKRITHNIKEFKEFFPGAKIYYAMKANSDEETLKTALKSGVGFEVASVYELNMLKAIKVPPEKIIYGTSVKPASHIKKFFNYGVNKFAFDSLGELEKIADLAPKSKVYVRIAVSDKGSVFKFSEKFGTEKENIISFLERAKELGLDPCGISFHVGSQASNVVAWANALDGLVDIMNKLSVIGIKLDFINMGGGFPCNKYLSSENTLELEEIAYHIFLKYKKLPYKPKIILEPGRGIVSDAAVLVASVIARVERREHTWLFLDAGVYTGAFEAMAYQGSTRYKITAMRQINGVDEMIFALAGPTGDSPDIITREVMLPRDIQVGDKIVIHDIGAYSIPTISRFNGFPKPDIYFI